MRTKVLLAIGLLGTALFAAHALFGRNIVYLALGDSLTAGEGASPEESFPAALTARLRALPLRWVELHNAGEPGAKAEQVITEQLPLLVQHPPNLVTLGIGTNDVMTGVKEEVYRAQVRSILASVSAVVPRRRIYVLPQGDWSRAKLAEPLGKPETFAPRIESFNRILREEAARAGVRFVDLGPLLARQAREGLMDKDGVHYSARAYEQWAEALAKDLLPRL